MKIVSDPVSIAAGRLLDYLSARQKVISANLANVDTPGYRVKDLTFQKELISAAAGKELPPPGQAVEGPGQFEIKTVEGVAAKHDGNNVNLDREMTLLAETSIKYNMMVQMMNGKSKILRTAVREGR